MSQATELHPAAEGQGPPLRSNLEFPTWSGMFKWKRQREPSEELTRVLAQLAELEKRVLELEEERDTRELEWNDWFTKFSSLYARLSKRARKELEEVEAPAAAPAPMSIGAQRLLSLGAK